MAGGIYCQEAVKWFGQKLLQYDSYLTNKETESLSLMAQLMSGSAGMNPATSAPHHCLNSFPTLLDKC